jgi:hypothetical protein
MMVESESKYAFEYSLPSPEREFAHLMKGDFRRITAAERLMDYITQK